MICDVGLKYRMHGVLGAEDGMMQNARMHVQRQCLRNICEHHITHVMKRQNKVCGSASHDCELAHFATESHQKESACSHDIYAYIYIYTFKPLIGLDIFCSKIPKSTNRLVVH